MSIKMLRKTFTLGLLAATALIPLSAPAQAENTTIMARESEQLLPSPSVPIILSQAVASATRITVSGSMAIKDDEPWPFKDERRTVPVSATAIIGPEPSSFVEMEGCAGDEVRVTLELDAQAAAAANNAAIVTGTARLFEGTDCATNDLEMEKSIRLTIPQDRYIPYTINLSNPETFGGDTAKITLNFHNARE